VTLDLFGWEAPPAPVAAPNPSPEPAEAAVPTSRPTPVEPDGAHVLAAVNRAGGRFRSIAVTTNRRVMLSVGDGGSTLRIHRRFLDAPEPVLSAVGRFLSARRRAERVVARAAIRDFVAEIRPSPTTRRRRRELHPSDAPLLERLQREFDRVNVESFDGELPSVPIFLSRRMRSRNGHFSLHPPEIVISHRLCVAARPGEAERTLRHEMIHLWQHHTGAPLGHGRDFRTMARRLDVHPRATRPVRWLDEPAR
jgi:hypothetical protein